MNKICLIILLLAPVFGQCQPYTSLTFGSNFSRISYRPRPGDVVESFKGKPGGVVALSYFMPALKEANAITDFITIDIGYKSSFIQPKQRAPSAMWLFHFFSTRVGIRHWEKRSRIITPFYNISMFADIMLKGKQISSAELVKLSSELKTIGFGLAFDAGLTYPLAHDMNVAVGLGYQRGLRNLEKYHDRQLHMHAWRLSFSMFVELSNHLSKKKSPGK